MVSNAASNEAAWRDPAFDDAYGQAVGTDNPQRRRQLLHNLQKIEYERSGYLLWGMADGVDLAAQQVRDLPPAGWLRACPARTELARGLSTSDAGRAGRA